MEKINYKSTDNIKLCGILSKVNSSQKIIILCHGFRGNKTEKNSFLKLEEALNVSNINSFRFDFRSHGESTGKDYEMTISGEIRDLESTINLLENMGYNEFILLGASFGAGIISLLDYKKYRNVKALICWYGALDYKHSSNKTFSDDNWEIAKREGYYTRVSKNGTITRMGLKLFNEINLYRPHENLSRLEIPILFVHGTQDTTVPPEISINVSKKCKNSVLKLIDNGRHTFDNSETALNEAIKETVNFIKNI